VKGLLFYRVKELYFQWPPLELRTYKISRYDTAMNDCRMLNGYAWLGFGEHDSIVNSIEGWFVPVAAVSGLTLPEFHNQHLDTDFVCAS
jgi:hypothetical protein